MDENPEKVTLKLEGRLAGPYTVELDRVWKETAPRLESRDVSLDLRETTYADAGGIRTLRSIYADTGAAILTATPWTEYLAEEVKRTETETEGEA